MQVWNHRKRICFCPRHHSQKERDDSGFLGQVRRDVIVARWVAFISVGVGECHLEDSFVLARNPYKGLAPEISYETGRRWGKARFKGNQRKNGVSDSRGKATVRERRLLSVKVGPVDPEAGSASAFLVAVWEFSSICSWQTQKHRMLGKCQKPFPSYA